MKSSRIFVSALLGLLCGAVGAGPVLAAPVLLGKFKNWSAYTTGTDNGKVCYVISAPQSMEPKNVKRGSVFLMISDWPGRKTKAEPEIQPGYSYKDGSTVTAEIGSDKFVFFTKNDGADGSAWTKDAADEPRLADAMRRGSQVIVTGLSTRGTMTRDTYSLSGISAALDKIHLECKM